MQVPLFRTWAGLGGVAFKALHGRPSDQPANAHPIPRSAPPVSDLTGGQRGDMVAHELQD